MPVETEPNNDMASADVIHYGEEIAGAINPVGDVDYYAFTGLKGETILADTDAEIDGSALDSLVYVYGPDGQGIDLAGGGGCFRSIDHCLSITLPEDGTYYLKVTEYDLWEPVPEGGPDYTYTLFLDKVIYLSAAADGQVRGMPYEDSDILAYYVGRDVWETSFDASFYGLTQNVTAFDVANVPLVYLAFSETQPVTFYNGETLSVQPHDFVGYWELDEPGPEYSGSEADLTVFFDGSVVHLSSGGEKIDALGPSPSWCGGSLTMSTIGNFSLNYTSGADHDVVRFTYRECPNSVPTGGTFKKALKGTRAGLGSEDINGLWFEDTSWPSGVFYLTMQNDFSVKGVAGDNNDIIKVWQSADGKYHVEKFWDASTAGFDGAIDAISLGGWDSLD